MKHSDVLGDRACVEKALGHKATPRRLQQRPGACRDVQRPFYICATHFSLRSSLFSLLSFLLSSLFSRLSSLFFFSSPLSSHVYILCSVFSLLYCISSLFSLLSSLFVFLSSLFSLLTSLFSLLASRFLHIFSYLLCILCYMLGLLSPPPSLFPLLSIISLLILFLDSDLCSLLSTDPIDERSAVRKPKDLGRRSVAVGVFNPPPQDEVMVPSVLNHFQ